MRSLIYIWILFSVFIAHSCELILEPRVKEVKPEIVVDGEISDGNFATVKLAWTSKLDENNEFSTIQNAYVIISENNLAWDTLRELTPGFYRGTKINGKIGANYELYIKTGDKEITAGGTIPDKIVLDSLKTFPSDFSYDLLPGYESYAGFRPYTLKAVYSDVLNQTNYYRLVYRVNSRNTGSSYIFDDRLNDGIQVGQSLFIYRDSIRSGDTVYVDFQCINRLVYKYFVSIGDFSGIPPAAVSPANPETNLKGTILGVFNCHTSDKRMKIIP